MWEAVLSNGELAIEDPADIGSWRKLRDKCRKEGLQIVELRYNGNPVHTRASGYFVFYNSIGFNRGPQITSRAIGCFVRNTEKVRVHWYVPFSTDRSGPTEVWPVAEWEMRNVAEEMRIPSVLHGSQGLPQT